MHRLMLLTALLLPLPALAANWKYVGEDTKQTTYSIDIESDQILNDGHHRIWELQHYILAGNNQDEYLKLLEFSCTGQFRTLEISKKDINGTIIFSSKTVSDWAYIKPGTIT